MSLFPPGMNVQRDHISARQGWYALCQTFAMLHLSAYLHDNIKPPKQHSPSNPSNSPPPKTSTLPSQPPTSAPQYPKN